MSALEELTQGEQLMQQYKLLEASKKLHAAAVKATKHGQHSICNMTYRYEMQISFYEGNIEEADKYLALIDDQISEPIYQIRHLANEIAKAIYNFELDRLDQVPLRMQEDYEECTFGVFKENLVNHIRMRNNYQKGDYDGVLLYEEFANEAVIYGKIEWF
jgi:DNA repair ATPase RecN